MDTSLAEGDDVPPRKDYIADLGVELALSRMESAQTSKIAGIEGLVKSLENITWSCCMYRLLDLRCDLIASKFC